MWAIVKTQKETHKELLDTFRILGQKHSIFTAFEDFLAMFAIAISNSVDKYHYEKQEIEYIRIVKKIQPTRMIVTRPGSR